MFHFIWEKNQIKFHLDQGVSIFTLKKLRYWVTKRTFTLNSNRFYISSEKPLIFLLTFSNIWWWRSRNAMQKIRAKVKYQNDCKMAFVWPDNWDSKRSHRNNCICWVRNSNTFSTVQGDTFHAMSRMQILETNKKLQCKHFSLSQLTKHL